MCMPGLDPRLMRAETERRLAGVRFAPPRPAQPWGVMALLRRVLGQMRPAGATARIAE